MFTICRLYSKILMLSTVEIPSFSQLGIVSLKWVFERFQGRPFGMQTNERKVTNLRDSFFTVLKVHTSISAFAIVGLVLSCIAVGLAQTQSINVPANSLPASVVLRRAVDGELKAQADDHSHWMYRVKESDGSIEKIKLVVESKDGELDRLQSVNGLPITAEEKRHEDQRIANLLHAPDRQKKRQRAQSEDADQTERMFKVLPDALTVHYGERKGALVELLFEPNPTYHAWSREAVVFHAMEGRIWIDTKANRLAEIEGHLTRTVKFGGGLLGYLDKGGEFNVRQAEVAPGHWEVTLLHVNMHGKILFLRTISEQQHEVRFDYHLVANDLTLAQAAEELQKQCSIQSADSSPKSPSKAGATAVAARQH
jgi:hypothetical protein